jgi:hypothetical protein
MVLWRIDPFLGNDRESDNKKTLLLSNRFLISNNLREKIEQQ